MGIYLKVEIPIDVSRVSFFNGSFSFHFKILHSKALRVDPGCSVGCFESMEYAVFKSIY